MCLNDGDARPESSSALAAETGTINGYGYRLCSTADSVERDDWDDVCVSADADVMMTLPFLRVLEAQQLFGSQQRYLVLTDLKTRQAVAAAIFTVLPVDVGAISGPTLRHGLTTIRRVMPHFLTFTVALCGTPLSLGQRNLVLRPSADRGPVLLALDLLLQRVASHVGTPFVGYKEFASQDLPTLDKLRLHGYQRVQNLPIYLFPTRFRDFQEYLAALKSTYRNSILRSQRKLQTEGVTIERIVDPEQIAHWYTEEVHALYLSVVHRAQYQFEVLNSAFFPSLARALPGELGFSVARTASGQTIGFFSSLFARGRFHGLYIGLDYAWNARCDLYFNLAYSELDYALRQRPQQIDLAQTAEAFKSRLGCEPEARYLYVRVRGGIRPMLLGWCLPLLFPNPKAMPALNILADRRASA